MITTHIPRILSALITVMLLEAFPKKMIHIQRCILLITWMVGSLALPPCQADMTNWWHCLQYKAASGYVPTYHMRNHWWYFLVHELFGAFLGPTALYFESTYQQTPPWFFTLPLSDWFFFKAGLGWVSRDPAVTLTYERQTDTNHGLLPILTIFQPSMCTPSSFVDDEQLFLQSVEEWRWYHSLWLSPLISQLLFTWEPIQTPAMVALYNVLVPPQSQDCVLACRASKKGVLARYCHFELTISAKFCSSATSSLGAWILLGLRTNFSRHGQCYPLSGCQGPDIIIPWL